MNRTFKAAVAALMLAVGSAGSVAAGPRDDVAAIVTAFKKGDYAIALRLVRPLAEQGDAIAQVSLAIMYNDGRGVPQNSAAAVSWLRKAAAQGDPNAQYNLGVHYDKGEGVRQDYAVAANWYHKAAAQGHAGAQYNLGVMFAQGSGVPQDYVLAYVWFNLAAAGGQDLGVKDRDMIAALITPAQLTELGVKGRNIVAMGMTPAQIAEAQKLVREWKPSTVRPAARVGP